MRLAIITTHPIQYYAPVFKLLQEQQGLEIKVFYTWGEKAKEKFDPGFGKAVSWDIPLLEGYPYQWALNTSPAPGSHHFKGIITPGLIQDIRNYAADALLVYGWAYAGHLKVIRHFKNRIPVFFRGDSTLLDKEKGIKQLMRTIFLKWVYRHIDHAFCVGSNNKAYFKKYGLKEKQLSFAPHAVDNERFGAPQTEKAALIRRNLGIGPSALLILFAGKFEQKKSPQLLLDAFLTLNTPEAHLLFVGNGGLETRLKTRAAGKRNVHFLEFQNQSAMPAVYQACDLFCLPSAGPGETWGLAVNEAMAAGKAVLVSDKCGCAADLVKPENGLCFKNEDINDLITALKTLTASKVHLAGLGRASKALIENWSFSIMAKTFTDQLLDEKNRPD
ncbi:glycosyltransferase family 4 protein [Mucilaginibacter angelicae]|uniref:Glycosyltransferase family 4 protein n=1 Tax=Mucilaginibacter angelicae TaxID=869718 RepID=A0ABV6L553_9SPHI